MEDKGYPKYQYSIFLKNGKDSQMVVRADDFEEFKGLIKNIQSLIDSNRQEHAEEVPVRDVNETKAEGFCSKHNKEMKQYTNEKGSWYSHAQPDKRSQGKWEYCSGKGFPTELGATRLEDVRG